MFRMSRLQFPHNSTSQSHAPRLGRSIRRQALLTPGPRFNNERPIEQRPTFLCFSHRSATNGIVRRSLRAPSGLRVAVVVLEFGSRCREVLLIFRRMAWDTSDFVAAVLRPRPPIISDSNTDTEESRGDAASEIPTALGRCSADL